MPGLNLDNTFTSGLFGGFVEGSRGFNFASGLGVLDFMKRTSILELDIESLNALSAEAMALAKAEGLEAHRRSVAIRLNVKS